MLLPLGKVGNSWKPTAKIRAKVRKSWKFFSALKICCFTQKPLFHANFALFNLAKKKPQKHPKMSEKHRKTRIFLGYFSKFMPINEAKIRHARPLHPASFPGIFSGFL